VWIAALQLHGYRNYDQLVTDLLPGLNLLFGENGQGKTNLVEAIYFLATGSSHRSSTNQNLIKNDLGTATISLTAKNESRELVVAAELNRDTANRFYVNGSLKKRLADVVGLIRAVIFAPEDLDLIRRDPSDRRKFLDDALVMLKPRLQGVRQDYDRVLKQRNALLKSARFVSKPDLTTLEIWDEQLVKLGTELIAARLELIAALEPIVNKFYQALSASTDQLSLRLESSITGSDESHSVLEFSQSDEISRMFHEKLQSIRGQELERGVSLVGPHRDELQISKAGLPARTQSSQGEAWSMALGLKLALGELVREMTSTDPVLLLDDVFSVLDVGRRNRLISFVSNYEQVVITSADRQTAPDLAWAKEIEISQGAIVGA
jgi:DNA replication and repair protein RecF